MASYQLGGKDGNRTASLALLTPLFTSIPPAPGVTCFVKGPYVMADGHTRGNLVPPTPVPPLVKPFSSTYPVCSCLAGLPPPTPSWRFKTQLAPHTLHAALSCPPLSQPSVHLIQPLVLPVLLSNWFHCGSL